MKLMAEGSTDSSQASRGRGIALVLSFFTAPVSKLTTINKFATCACTNLLLVFALLPGLIT
jgi:hypothetical protein